MRTVIVFSRASLTTTPARILRAATDAWGVSAIRFLFRTLFDHRQDPCNLAPALRHLGRALESAAGVQEGGRSGLTAVTVAVLFLAALFFSPLAGTVPAYATAPALFFADMIIPLREGHRNAAGYLDRLMGRPSFARALEEARPYLGLVPK